MGQLEETVRVILELRRTIARYRENFEGNEAQTRVSLIDPMLRALGWDVSNPAEVAQETGRGAGFADYALKDLRSGVPLMIVEAKSLNRRLDDAHYQVAEYCYAQNINKAVVTDGDDWILLAFDEGSFGDELDVEEYYDDDDESVVEIPLLEVARFSVSRGDAVVSALDAQNFVNPASRSVDWSSELEAALQRASITRPATLPTNGEPHTPRHQRSLGSLRELNNPEVPDRLHFPDGYVFCVLEKSWSELVRNVAVYLGVIYEVLYEVELPIWAPRSRTKYVANDRPRHDNRRDFGQEFEVGDGVYVELDHTSRSGVNAACTLLDECGIDPHLIAVEYDNNP